jgi:hypothetical protein
MAIINNWNCLNEGAFVISPEEFVRLVGSLDCLG